ncbi:bifunctional diguanylate cyclase/phosphodiesterase [Bacillus sp. HMF5848]|uniref:sensor domain-containing protein n=1 Tax=Bacillus sp. HMF5848 TaxID=2495421 RepID=UPI000F79CD2D|nr:bifunctional diguanylate cyclase/phosphodiesterase [Bacillus sp. HMF5848]RSK28328.1 bifunctional diguanylate cyclase/phosphodiesterase [Bacillus sp. HMF5848]
MTNHLSEIDTHIETYISLFKNNPDASYALDLAGRFTLFNESAVQLTGYTQDEVKGEHFTSLMKNDEAKVINAMFPKVISGDRRSFETTIIRKDGVHICISVTAVPIIKNGVVQGIIGIAKDMTERNSMLAELTFSRNQLQNIFDSIDICLWSIDVKTMRVFQISPACEDIFGYKQEEFLQNAQLWENTIHPEDKPIIEGCHQELLMGKTVNIEYRALHKDGHVIWVSDYIVPVFNYESNELIRLDGVIKDMTDQKEVEKQLQFMAYHDPLTELPNRRRFNEKVLEAIKYAEKHNELVGIMYLDLDRFKFINDTLGHNVGDEFLKIISKRLVQFIEGENVHATVTRQGGDEFAIVLCHVRVYSELCSFAEKLLPIITEPIHLNNNTYTITTSIGISIYPDHSTNLDGLIVRADQAMYLAKEKGKNTYQVYQTGLTDGLTRKMNIEQSLHKAIDKNELYLEYQPIVNIFDNNIIGLEALLRWNHTKLGKISPAEFIHIAEESGQIIKVGYWVLQKVVEHLNTWRQIGLPEFYVSVNISGRQLSEEYFLNTLKTILKTNTVSPESIKFEITESVAMTNVSNMMKQLNEIRNLGIDIFLDDFGTGYSSLSYLKKFPIHTVKIDQSFVRGLNQKNYNRSICKAIVSMAQSLNMNVIAEGVEEENQWLFLKEIGCGEMQGYYFSKPTPVDTIEKLFGFKD